MTLKQYVETEMPEYYSTMFLDGFTPEEILMAKRRQMFQEQQEQETTSIHVTSEIKKK